MRGRLPSHIRGYGVGMEIKNINQIERFHKLGTINQNTEGLGLGLAIVSRIINLSGCKLSISDGLNSGTRIEILLPRRAN